MLALLLLLLHAELWWAAVILARVVGGTAETEFFETPLNEPAGAAFDLLFDGGCDGLLDDFSLLLCCCCCFTCCLHLARRFLNHTYTQDNVYLIRYNFTYRER